jgi:lipopolysaccharide export system permease protein
VALAYTLNKLNTDSEIVVMNAAGMSPWHVFWPFVVVSIIVALMVSFISFYLAPKCLRELRIQLTKVRADLVANVIQPGRFTSVDEQRLTFHVRERRPNGELLGIFIDDRRNPAERGTFLAERGQVLEGASGTFLVLENGSAQRIQTKDRDPTIVLFERYAFDLSQLTGSGATPTFGANERYFWELAAPDPNDPYVKANATRIRTEFHERLSAVFYPFVFVVICFAILGAPRTSRQSRSFSILMTIVAVGVVRLTGFAGLIFSARTPAVAYLMYGGIVGVIVGGLVLIARGAIIEPPAILIGLVNALQARLSRSAAAGSPA